MFDPPRKKIQSPKGTGPLLLLVVIDTEEEFDWSRPHSRENTAVTSLATQTAAQAIFETKGLVPTYVVDYPVATSDLAREIMRPWAAAGRCIIGAHLHPWVNPPFEEAISAYNTYPGNLSADLERSKLEILTEAIEKTFGQRPDIYKAGRYGLGSNSAATLEALGYRVDMSVVPYSNFGDDGGPDFTAFDFWPFWFGRQRDLLEIPLACGFYGHLRHLGPRVYPHLISPSGLRLHLPGVFARTGLLERIRLTPEGLDLAANKRLTRALLDQGCKVFTLTYHSPSLTPGMTPYVRDHAELRRFLDELGSYLDFFLNELGGRASTPYDVYNWAQQPLS